MCPVGAELLDIIQGKNSSPTETICIYVGRWVGYVIATTLVTRHTVACWHLHCQNLVSQFSSCGAFHSTSVTILATDVTSIPWWMERNVVSHLPQCCTTCWKGQDTLLGPQHKLEWVNALLLYPYYGEWHANSTHQFSLAYSEVLEVFVGLPSNTPGTPSGGDISNQDVLNILTN